VTMNTYMILALSIGLCLLGATANFTVVYENDCRMPVYTSEYISSNAHFAFEDKEEVEFFWLSDIIPIWQGYASIGDILYLSGTVLAVMLVALLTLSAIKSWWACGQSRGDLGPPLII